MDFDHPPTDPVALLSQWLHEAEALDMANPNAMSLATIDHDGRPSVRTVLLKAINDRGIVFFTNKDSRKGRALQANPRAAAVLYWDKLHRQVIIEGDVTPADDSLSDSYFATRSRSSRIGAWASRQSQPATSRAELDKAYSEVEKKFEGKDIPRPPHWGGFVIAWNRIEFWHGRDHRMHDRIDYTRTPDGAWKHQRLQP